MNWFSNLWQTKRTPFILFTVLIAVMFALPAFAGEYNIYLVMRILILALFAYSVNLLLGYTGLLSFGQAAFFGVGAYGCGKLLLENPGIPIPAALIFGVAIAALFALILGLVCVRHTAIYFAMLTLAFGMMTFQGVRRVDWLGRYQGLQDVPRPPLEAAGFAINMESTTTFYYFVLIVSAIAIFLFYRLIHSPMGLSFQAIRDSESRVGFTGFSIRNTRLLSFVIAGAYAGLAGGLYVLLDGNIVPDDMGWAISAQPIVAVLLGGMYTFAGPIVGAVIFFLMRDIVFRYVVTWMLGLGIIIVVLVMALPGGIVGYIEEWLARRRGKPSVRRE